MVGIKMLVRIVHIPLTQLVLYRATMNQAWVAVVLFVRAAMKTGEAQAVADRRFQIQTIEYPARSEPEADAGQQSVPRRSP
mgnify:CR=1 FL=1